MQRKNTVNKIIRKKRAHSDIVCYLGSSFLSQIFENNLKNGSLHISLVNYATTRKRGERHIFWVTLIERNIKAFVWDLFLACVVSARRIYFSY